MKERATTVEYTSLNSTMPASGNNSSLPGTFCMDPLIIKLPLFIISLAGLAGNAVVLWLLGFCIQRNAMSVYILNLAAADLLYLSIQIICFMTGYICHFCDIKHTSQFSIAHVSMLAYIASVSMLTAISTERCLCVLKPIWYRCHRPKHMSITMCALLWAVSLFLSILIGICNDNTQTDGEHRHNPSGLFITVTWLILLFVLLSGSSLIMLVRLLCGSKKIQLPGLYMTIGISVLFFLLCDLPYSIYWFLRFVICNLSSESSDDLMKAVYVLSCLNSCANPIIYFFVGFCRQKQKHQQTLKLVLQRALEDTPEVAVKESSLPQETLKSGGNQLSCFRASASVTQM